MSFKRKWGGGGVSADVPEARPATPELDPEKVQHVPATEKPFDPSLAETRETRMTDPATEQEEAGAELAHNLVGEPTNEGADLASPSSPPMPEIQSVPMRVGALQIPPPDVTQSTSKEADPLPYAPPTHVRVGGGGVTVVHEFGPRRSRKVDGNPDDLPITNDPPHVEPVASSNDPANRESKPSDDPQHNLVPRAGDAPELVQRAPELEESDESAELRKYEREMDARSGLDDVDELLTPVTPPQTDD